MAAARIQTQAAVMAERSSGGISAGEHLIHDAIVGGGAWAAETAVGVNADQRLQGFNKSVTNTTPVTVAEAWSGGMVGLANNTGVPVLVEFGKSETPTVVDANYGRLFLPPNGALNVAIPGVRISVARLTAQATPTATNPSVCINYENAGQLI